MTIDMSQFHQVFFEESFENLALMEAGLLSLAEGAEDPEVINTIFRGAHSIKGGSSTFGFSEIADFTHVMESLLDEMRAGRRPVTPDAIELLLGSVDLLGRLLEASSKDQPTDSLNVNDQLKKLTALQAVQAVPDESVSSVAHEQPETIADSDNAIVTGWHIVFHPLVHMMRTGNDPLVLFKALQQLGQLSVDCDYTQLPKLSELTPDEMRLCWDLKLEGVSDRAELTEVFDWVEDDCNLVILPMFSDAFQHDTVSVLEPTQPNPSDTNSGGAVQADAPSVTPSVSRSDAGANSIRVETRKIDSLINMIGELVITQSMLETLGEHFTLDKLGKLQEGLEQLKRHASDLHEGLMRVRMLPISFAFNRFPRLVHDLSVKLGKQAVLEMSGADTEVDKTVIEKMTDPLVHLIRNSLDHGLESPEERRQAGKSETGCIKLNAYQKGGSVFIELQDNGRGLDKARIFEKAVSKGLVDEKQTLAEEQLFELIFHPGFSTTAEANDVSGRGVGMDVVRRNINELGGTIQITSEEGEGCLVSISLPLSLAIMEGQLVSVGNEVYIIPLLSIIESVQPLAHRITRLTGKGEVYKLRDEFLPVIRINELFGVPASSQQPDEGLFVIVEGDGRLCALHVDELLGQKQLVIKSLEDNYDRVEGISGATILGDGSVGLILDVPGIVGLAGQGRGLRMSA
ncbi:MAG: chemotaxis protein CheA [Sedimenticola sp.]|nr:chemotaxis protein CheA [Sedimenticola sp.]